MALRILLAALVLPAMAAGAAAEGRAYGAAPAGMDAYLARLAAAYPGTIAGHEGGFLVLKDGSRIAVSDGRADKSFQEMLDDPDIDDMFVFPYPAGAEPAAPPHEHDPGRIRVEALFRALYGDCRKGEVDRQMRRVAWVPRHGGGTVSITTAQGADKALERVSAELDALPSSLTKYLVPTAGTYNCRTIAGTERMSMHAYGAAIDISTQFSDYWRWTKPDADGRYRWRNRIPKEIVDVFERHGFVWGGRWYHFDTMHFEYRPELASGRK